MSMYLKSFFYIPDARSYRYNYWFRKPLKFCSRTGCLHNDVATQIASLLILQSQTPFNCVPLLRCTCCGTMAVFSNFPFARLMHGWAGVKSAARRWKCRGSLVLMQVKCENNDNENVSDRIGNTRSAAAIFESYSNMVTVGGIPSSHYCMALEWLKNCAACRLLRFWKRSGAIELSNM